MYVLESFELELLLLERYLGVVDQVVNQFHQGFGRFLFRVLLKLLARYSLAEELL